MRIAPDDPALLTSHQRLLELAAIFATGVQRLRTRPCLVDDDFPEAARSGLALSALSGPDREQGECEQ